MLNSEQIKLKSKIKGFLESKDKGFFGVIGGGGTGKTFTVTKSIDSDDCIYLGATNKVVNNLKKELNDNHLFNAEAKTIDRFLNFTIKKDHNNKTITKYRPPKIKDIPAIIIIDEISLINNSHFEHLLKLKNKRKFILIGDNKQIPPIEDEFVRDSKGFKVSKIFTELDYSFELKVQNRQDTKSELYNLIFNFRQNMDKKIPFVKMAEVKQNSKDVLYFNDFNDKGLRKIMYGESPIAICYKNLSVLSYAWLIGSTKFNDKGYKVNSLNDGDTVFFDSYFRDGDTVFYTSDLVEIVSINNFHEETILLDGWNVKFNYKIVTIKDGKSLKKVRVSNGYKETIYPIYYRKNYLIQKLKDKIQKVNDAPVMNNKYYGVLKKQLSELNTEYSDIMLRFAKLKKPYSLTCHKSQGSTYEDVIIPIYDYYNKHHQDVNQLMYVAMSRAKKRVIFVNKKTNFKDNSNRYSFSELERTAVASDGNYECNICTKSFEDNRDFDVDHIIPINNGGTNSKSNLQAICKPCHKEKTALEKQN